MFNIIAMVIGIGTAIAFELNYFNMIPNITPGDWLGFWGAYIGGTATLAGVSLTLWKSDQDKKEVKENEKPVIVPLTRECPISICDDGTVKIVWRKDGYGNIKDSPFISIINIGKEHALSLQVELKKIEYSKIKEISEQYTSTPLIIEENYMKYFNEKILLRLYNEVIKISGKNETDAIVIPNVLDELCTDIINNININNLSDVFFWDIPLCKIYFQFKSVCGDNHFNEYYIYANIDLSKKEGGNLSLHFQPVRSS